MSQAEGRSRGGQTQAKRSRDEAIQKYYENPKTCKYCGRVIEVKEGQKVAEVRLKEFCNRSCAGFYNSNKEGGSPKNTAKPISPCEGCGEPIYLKKGKRGYLRRRFCETCTALRLEIPTKTKGRLFVESKEKGPLLSKGWQCARSQIARNARRVFAETGRPLRCEHPGCTYDHYAEVCHRKPVSDFPDSATVKEINDPENLMALCPNHHWDLDHGITIQQGACNGNRVGP